MRTRPESSESRRTNLVALCVLGALVVAAPELLGGVYPWGVLAITAGSLLAFTIVAYARAPLAWSPLLSVMSITLLWTVVQSLPLPCALVRVLAPESALELGRARQLFGLGPSSFCALSRDPTATREEVLKGIAILATFWASLTLARRGFRPVIHHAVAASGVLLAAVALGHSLLEAKRVFGVYKPVDVRDPPILSPLLNVNTLGGVLMMCVPLLMALALAETEKARKAMLVLANSLVLCAVFMSRSRGAIGGVAIAIVAFAVLALRRWQGGGARRLSWSKRLERMGVPLALAFGFGVVAYVWNVETVREFRNGGWDKLALIAAAGRFALAHPWIGVGRGAFASSFAGPIAATRFDYAENFVVQWAAEWGLPITLLLLAALGYTFLSALRRVRSLDRIGALVGLATFGLQNLFDFGFELLGVSVLAVALLGAATTDRQPLREVAGDRARTWLRPAALAFASVAAGLSLICAAPIARDSRVALERSLGEKLSARDYAGFQRLLRQAVLAHPSEPAYPLLAASEAIQRRDPSAGKWINRGLQLRPLSVGPHLQATQWLWNSGRYAQALLELGVAVGIDRYESRGLSCPIAAKDPLGAARAMPRGEARSEALELLVACFDEEKPAARAIDRVILSEFPSDPRPHLREGRRLLLEREPEAALREAELARHGELQPKTASNVLRARALADLGRADEAIALLRETARSATDPSSLLGLEAELHCARGDRPGMLDALERMRGSAAGEAASMAGIFQLQGRLEARLGNLHAAVQAFRQAYNIMGDTGSLNAIAETAERAGDRGQALWAYRELCEGPSTDRAACAKRDQLLATSTNFEFPVRAAQPIQR